MVFGSRTTIMCSDASAAAAVTLAAGAMVADRCVLLPGVTVGRRCVLGSGSVTRPGRTYASGATMLGSQGGDCVVLDAGSGLTGAVMACNAGVPVAPLPSTPDKGGADTEHAFGRTFYGSQRQRSAVSWPVPPTWSITAAAMAAYGFGAAADHGRFVLALVITTRFAIVPTLGRGAEASPWEAARAAASFLVLACCCMVVIRTVTVPLGALASAGAKRLLIGRRVQGNHAWDRSSYCIRWKAYHVLESLLVDLSKLCGSVRGANPPPPHPRPRTNVGYGRKIGVVGLVVPRAGWPHRQGVLPVPTGLGLAACRARPHPDGRSRLRQQCKFHRLPPQYARCILARHHHPGRRRDGACLLPRDGRCHCRAGSPAPGAHPRNGGRVLAKGTNTAGLAGSCNPVGVCEASATPTTKGCRES